MEIVDTHVHIGSFPSLEDLSTKIRTRADAAGFRSRFPDLFDGQRSELPIDNTAQFLEVMDRYDIAKALIQCKTGIPNEVVGQMAQAHSDRLFPMPSLHHGWESAINPNYAPEFAAEMIDRFVTQYRAKGIGEIAVHGLTSETHPDKIAADLTPLFEVARRHQIPIQIPTAWTQFRGGLFYGDSLWVDPLAEQFPEVPIILTKMGRGLTRYFEACLVVALRNSNIYFDIAHTTGEHLRRAIDEIGADRIVFGSDWSATWQWLREPADVHTSALRVLEDARVTERERHAIVRDTATQLFGLAG